MSMGFELSLLRAFIQVIDVDDDVDDNDQDRGDQDDQDVPPPTKKTKQPKKNAARTPDETARIRLEDLKMLAMGADG